MKWAKAILLYALFLFVGLLASQLPIEKSTLGQKVLKLTVQGLKWSESQVTALVKEAGFQDTSWLHKSLIQMGLRERISNKKIQERKSSNEDEPSERDTEALVQLLK